MKFTLVIVLVSLIACNLAQQTPEVVQDGYSGPRAVAKRGVFGGFGSYGGGYGFGYGSSFGHPGYGSYFHGHGYPYGFPYGHGFGYGFGYEPYGYHH